MTDTIADRPRERNNEKGLEVEKEREKINNH